MPATHVYRYDEKALATLALLFGPGFIHPGSQTWAQTVCQEIDLSGKKVLDFGCGTGGVACALAQCDAQISGLDFSDTLLAFARTLALDNKLGDRVHFETITTLPLPFTHKFDLIISYNTISHCKDKDKLFIEFKRLLRTNGTLVIADWFCKSAQIGDALNAFLSFTDSIMHLNTAQDYLQLLEKNNFSYVNFKDTTKNMRDLCEQTLYALKINHEEEIVTQFGAEYYEWWVEYWSLLYAALQSGDLLAGGVRGIRV